MLRRGRGRGRRTSWALQSDGQRQLDLHSPPVSPLLRLLLRGARKGFAADKRAQADEANEIGGDQ